jgi:hypothetical protein
MSAAFRNLFAAEPPENFLLVTAAVNAHPGESEFSRAEEKRGKCIPPLYS